MSSNVTDRRLGLTGGKGFKDPVKVATIANITLSGEQTIDGVAVTSGDYVLVKDQSTQTENGIYIASTGAWARRKDFNGNLDAVRGCIVFSGAGSTQIAGFYQLLTPDPIVIGVSNIEWAASISDTYFPLSKYDATTAPTVNDDTNDGYRPGSIWLIPSTGARYLCVDADVGAADWRVFPQLMVYNVKDYGVTGDGTTDDSTNINAIVSALTGGCELYFPFGDYRIDSPILDNGKSVIFRGAGARILAGGYVTSISPNGDTDAFRLTGSMSKVMNMAIDGSNQTGTTADGIVIGFGGANSFHTQIENVWITDIVDDGVVWEHGPECRFENLRMINCGGNAMTCTDNYQDNNHGTFINVHATDCGGWALYCEPTATTANQSRHHRFLEYKNFSCANGFHLVGDTNWGALFSENTVSDHSGSPLTLDSTTVANSIWLLGDVGDSALSAITDNGTGNDITYVEQGAGAFKKDLLAYALTMYGSPSLAGRIQWTQTGANAFRAQVEGTSISTTLDFTHNNGGANFTTRFDRIAVGASQDIITEIIHQGATVNHGTVAATSFAETTMTVTGAATGDHVDVSPTAALPTGLIFAGAWVSAANTVTIRLYNPTGVGVPSSIGWRALVTKVA